MLTTMAEGPEDDVPEPPESKNDIVDICNYVIQKAEEYSIVSENAPPSIAAGCIYLISVHYKMNISKKEIAKACEISEVTINKCYKKLLKYKDYIIPKTEEDVHKSIR